MCARSELDYHADTTVTGVNYYIFQYTGKDNDISPRCDYCEYVKFVEIVHVENVCQPPETGKTYIFVLCEALFIIKTLDHTLVNMNQLHHYVT